MKLVHVLFPFLMFGISLGCSSQKLDEGLIPRSERSFYRGDGGSSICTTKPTKEVFRSNTAIMHPPAPDTLAEALKKFGRPLKKEVKEVVSRHDDSLKDKVITLSYPGWQVRYYDSKWAGRDFLLDFTATAKDIKFEGQLGVGSSRNQVYSAYGDMKTNLGLVVRDKSLRYCYVDEDPFCKLIVSPSRCLLVHFGKDSRVSKLEWHSEPD